MKKWNLFILLILFCIYGTYSEEQNSTITTSEFNQILEKSISTKTANIIKLKRQKRFLIWAGTAVSKSVLGVLIPVVLGDRVNWRALNMIYNFQAQFVPIPSVIYPWTRFERSLRQQKEDYNINGNYVKDNTRKFAYSAVELMMNRKGNNGRECLFRAICEAAQSPVKTDGLFEEVIHLFLTPNPNEVEDDYIDAMLAGKYGADCLSLYTQCPIGKGFLDHISYLI